MATAKPIIKLVLVEEVENYREILDEQSGDRFYQTKLQSGIWSDWESKPIQLEFDYDF